MARIAFVGCGYVASFYLASLPNYPQLDLAGVYDQQTDRAARIAARHKVRHFHSLDEILNDPGISILVNLTNPRSHYEVSRAALEAGKHVYSEKPLAMSMHQASELVELARSRKLIITSAPCSVLGETAQTLWKAIRNGRVGKVRVIYAEMDDGMIPKMSYSKWLSGDGIPWPHKDEFEIGCTLEHAGYLLTWLAAFFGPAKTVTAYSSCLMPDKLPAEKLDPPNAPDFTVACIEYVSGPVARLTCSILAPRDHSLRIIGDEGVLSIKECWDYGSPVLLHTRTRLADIGETYPLIGRLFSLGLERVPLVKKPSFRYRVRGSSRMDFSRGVADVADAITQCRDCRISAEVSLHVNELMLAITDGMKSGKPYEMTTTISKQMDPMDWAR